VNAKRYEFVVNTVEECFEESGLQASYFRKYSDYVWKLISEIDVESIKRVADCFLQAREQDKVVYFAGNGGSAATASHFSQDLAEISRKVQGKAFKTQSLSENISLLTAISNDYGYEHVFSMQIQQNFNSGDVLVAISASGNSPNVIKAAELAKEKGGLTIGLVGFDGGLLARICDHVVHVRSKKGDYGPVEDIHLMLDHMLVSYLHMKLTEGGHHCGGST
jgi:D-sedoheptulose 7-phosphate isomerase